MNEDDEDFIPLAQPRTTRYKPEVVVLRKPRSEDMRVVVDAEIRAVEETEVRIKIERPIFAILESMRHRRRHLNKLARDLWIILA